MAVGRLFSVLALAIAVFSDRSAFSQSEPQARFDPIASTASEIKKVVELVNEERKHKDLPPLVLSDRLCLTARWHAMDMAVGNYFDHKDRQGRSVGQRLSNFGYKYSYCGQNIAAGQQTPEETVAAWMKSPSHRENILRREFREMGIALVANPNSKYGRYWVQDFGTP